MTEPLTDAELDALFDSFTENMDTTAASAIAELREQYRAYRLRAIEERARLHWRAAMAQINVGQKVLEQLAAADALADAVEMAETSIQWYAWPDLAAALIAYRERRGRNVV